MFAAEAKASRLAEERQRVALEWESTRQPAARTILPNVKDEPRPQRAWLVQVSETQSEDSNRKWIGWHEA